MGRCTANMCKSFIFLLNTILAIAALAIMAASIYLLVELYSGTASAFITESGYYAVGWVPLGISVVLLILALVGCCSTAAEKKCCLGFYGFLQFVFGVVIIVAGAALLTADSAAQDNAAAKYPAAVSDKTWDFNQLISDTSVATFSACCENKVVTDECSEVNSNNDTLCFWSADAYQSIYKSLKENSDSCKAINDQISCTSAYPSYAQNFADYASSFFFPCGIAITVFGSFIFICFLGSMYLCCCHKKGRGNGQPTGQTSQYASKV